jgi:hypothetical protein
MELLHYYIHIVLLHEPPYVQATAPKHCIQEGVECACTIMVESPLTIQVNELHF